MHLQKVKSKKKFFVDVLKATDENSRVWIRIRIPIHTSDYWFRIRIHTKISWIRKTASSIQVPGASHAVHEKCRR
jgi:hypothetical protein